MQYFNKMIKWLLRAFFCGLFFIGSYSNLMAQYSNVAATISHAKMGCAPATIEYTINYNQAIPPADVQYSSVGASSVVRVSPSNAFTSASTHIIQFTYNSEGSYSMTLTVDDSSPLFSKTSGAVNITGAPSLGTITPTSSSICQGTTSTDFNVSGSNYSTLTWSVTGSGNTINSNGLVTWASGFYGTATISAVASGACSPNATSSTTMTVYKTPTNYSLNAPSAICAGTSATVVLSGSEGGITYQLYKNNSPDGGAVSGNGSQIHWAGRTQGTYKVLAYSNSGCTWYLMGSEKTISTASPGNLSISKSPSSTIVCPGNVTLTASGGSGYQWSTGQTGTSITVNPGAGTTTNYSVTGNESVCGTSKSATAQVQVYTVVGQVSTPSGGGASRCQGGGTTTYTASATNANSYAWAISPSGAGTISSTGTVTWNAEFIGPSATISVTAYGNCGSSSSSSTSVTIEVPATPQTVYGPDQLCTATETATIVLQTSQSGFKYRLFKLVSSDYVDQNVELTGGGILQWPGRGIGTYKVKAHNINSSLCGWVDMANTKTITAKTVENFTASITVSPSRTPAEYCQGETITFTAGSSHSASYYTWKKNDIGVLQGAQASVYSLTTMAETDVISLEVTIAPNQCVNNSVATASTAGWPVIIRPYATLTSISPLTEICQGTTSTTFTSNAANHKTLTWSISNAGTSTIDSVTGIVTWDTGFYGTASITATANGYCPGSQVALTKSVVVRKAPSTPTAPVVETYCGYENLPAFVATSTEDPGLTVYHQWYTAGDVAIDLPVLAAPTYSGSGTYRSTFKPELSYFSNGDNDTKNFKVETIVNACVGTRFTTTATIHPRPVADQLQVSIAGATYTDPFNLCQTGAIEFTLTGGDGSIAWYDPANNVISTSRTFTYTPTKAGVYKVTTTQQTVCDIFALQKEFTILSIADYPTSWTIEPDQWRFEAGEIRFTAKEMIVKANDNAVYNWYRASDGFELATKTTTFTDEIGLGTTGYYARVWSESGGCLNPTTIPLTAHAYPLPQVTVPGNQYLETGQSTTLQLNTTYPNIKWYKDGTEVATNTQSYSAISGGSYIAKAVLTTGVEQEAAVINVYEWKNRPTTAGSSYLVEGNVPATETGTTPNNYVRTFVPRQAYLNAADVSTSRTKEQVMISTSYMDGLGRKMQDVNHRISPDGKDIITPAAYDALGRQTRAYLPYKAATTDGSRHLNALVEQYDYYNLNAPANVAHTDVPFSSTRYEASPLNRVIETAAPGEDWYPGAGWDRVDRKTQKITHRSNYLTLDGEIKNLLVNAGVFSLGTPYPDGSLIVQEMADENGARMIEYKDKQGQVILKRNKTAKENFDTYYIYDVYSQLVAVIPPEATESLNTSDLKVLNELAMYDDSIVLLRESTTKNATVTQTEDYLVAPTKTLTLAAGFHMTGQVGTTFHAKALSSNEMQDRENANTVFRYTYNNRGQMISKKVPGAGEVYMVYDQWDRVVLTQDAKLREQGKWMFTKYDILNRPIISGIKAISGALSSIRTNVLAATGRYETINLADTEIGYTLTATYPSAVAADILSVTYYDNYDQVPASLAFNGSFGQPIANKLNFVTGQVTGSKVRKLDDNLWISSATYFDNKNRPIQAVSINAMGGTDRETMQYDFGGNVIKTVSSHKKDAAADELLVVKTMAYDHANRLKTLKHVVTDNPAATPTLVLARNDYNDLGQLIDKNLHSEDGGTTFAQSVDYRYNSRGWLTHINNDALSSDGGQTNDDANALNSDFFGMELNYNQGYNYGQFNGNISGISWRNVLDDDPQSYGYVYDELSRIKMADYVAGSIWNVASKGQEVRVSEYDQNGNIKKLMRRGVTSQNTTTLANTYNTIDNLTYHYLGNQLNRVDDSSNATKGFKNGANVDDEYTYDANGNMEIDKNKGITAITYNYLNLPTEVVKSNGDKINYGYDAAGIKYRQVVTKGSTKDTTLYLGSFIYEKDTLKSLFTEEGRIINDPYGNQANLVNYWQGLDYQYHLKDHLGNVRTTFSTQKMVLNYLATMEPGQGEESDFENLETRHLDAGRQTTPGGSYAAYLYGESTMVGPGITLKVNKGDALHIEVQAQYLYQTGQAATLSALSAAVATAFGGVEGSSEASGALFDLLSGAVGAVGLLGSQDPDEVANATLNYLFFDENLNFVNLLGKGYDFDAVTSAAATTTTSFANWETLALDWVADRKGYIYIYVANETPGDNVWFDDLQVIHTEHPVVQADDYYPFGLAFNSYSSGLKNDYLYNDGAERQDELDLNVDFTLFRMYDPAIGRWWQVDPKTEELTEHTPYNYAFNNPIRFNDPLGDCPPDDPDCNRGGGSSALINVAPLQMGLKILNFIFNNVVNNPEQTRGGLSTASSASAVVEVATDGSKGTLKTVNKVSKKAGPVAAVASVLVDGATTDFENTEETGDFIENTVQTAVSSTPLVGPGLDVIMENAKGGDGTMNAKNLSKNFSSVFDAQQQRTQARIQRLKNSYTGPRSTKSNQNNQSQQSQQSQQGDEQTETCDENGCN